MILQSVTGPGSYCADGCQPGVDAWKNHKKERKKQKKTNLLASRSFDTAGTPQDHPLGGVTTHLQSKSILTALNMTHSCLCILVTGRVI